MGSSSPTSENKPALQPGERISGPLPSLLLPSSAIASMVPHQVNASSRRYHALGNVLGVLGGALTIFGFFLPTYLAAPLLTLPNFQRDYSVLLSAENASVTGVQVLLFNTPLSYVTNFWLLIWQILLFLAASNALMLGLSTRALRPVLKKLRWLAVFLFLPACVNPYFLLYSLVPGLPLLLSLAITLSLSERARSRLALAWPLAGIGALMVGTAHFFSTISSELSRIHDPAVFYYHYVASVGPGAWLSFAGLLTALLGGVLALQASTAAAHQSRRTP